MLLWVSPHIDLSLDHHCNLHLNLYYLYPFILQGVQKEPDAIIFYVIYCISQLQRKKCFYWKCYSVVETKCNVWPCYLWVISMKIRVICLYMFFCWEVRSTLGLDFFCRSHMRYSIGLWYFMCNNDMKPTHWSLRLQWIWPGAKLRSGI